MPSKQTVLTRKAAMTLGAVHGFLKSRLAMDAKVNLVPILAKLTSKNFAQQKPVILKGIKHALDGKLAKDASVEGLATLLDALEEEKAMDDPMPLETEPNGGLPPEDASMDQDDRGMHDALREFLKGVLSPEDLSKAEAIISAEAGDEELGSEKAAEEGEDEPAEREEMAERIKENQKPAKDKKTAKDEPPPFKGKPEVGGGMSKDSVNKAIQEAVANARAAANAVRDAERYVQPWVGQITMAHDSAEAVFKTALTAMGVETKGVHPSAYKSILDHVPVPSKARDTTVMAHDSASAADFAKRHPGAAAIKFA